MDFAVQRLLGQEVVPEQVRVDVHLQFVTEPLAMPPDHLPDAVLGQLGDGNLAAGQPEACLPELCS